MAISPEERISVFQILGVPLHTPMEFYKDLSSKETINRASMLYVETFAFIDYPYTYSDEAIRWVDARLGSLTPEEESAVQDLVSEWDAISLEAVKVETSQIKLNYDKIRSLIRQRLKIIIPVKVRGDFSNDSPMVSIG